MLRSELNGDEADTPHDLLRTTLDELHSEISRTYDRDLLARLKQRQATLKGPPRRLEPPA